MKKFIFTALFFSAFNTAIYAQVGIGTATPNASSVLDLTSTTKAFIPPRMNTTQRNQIVSPTAGMMIFNIDSTCTEIYRGAVWFNECTKNSTYPIQGLWIGTYTSDQQPGAGSQYYSYIIKPDGTMIYDAKASTNQYIAIGTWNLVGTTFTTTYTNIWSTLGPTGVTQSATATFDNTGKLKNGTWQNAGGGATGTFTLTRVN